MMKINKQNTLLFFATIIVVAFSFGCQNSKDNDKHSQASQVTLKVVADSYQLYVNGEAFYIKGAGLECGNIKSLADHGGNALRTWRTDSPCRKGNEILDEAKKNGLMVCMGLEIARERHGFDYNDSAAVREQFEYAKAEVLKYKDHPALLAWGIGNELNLHSNNPKVWDAVNEIAEMIHETDPNHPVTTMLAGADKNLLALLEERCPALDYLSFQLYGDIVNLPDYLHEANYKGAYVVSEWGATGHWEVAKTEWGRPIEPNSHQKALDYQDRYMTAIAGDPKQCIGSFVFLWGQKQERTPTWYGMFLENSHSTEAVDVMEYMWTGRWPENKAPAIESFELDGKTAYQNVYLSPGSATEAVARVNDPENEILSYRWEILPEVPEHHQSDGGDFEKRPETILQTSSQEPRLNFTAPEAPGAYRIFVYATDGNKKAATANIPFYIN
jgi:hypothetical protein